MESYEKIYNDVASMVSEKRLKHCEGVAKMAVEYAKIYNVDVEKARLCGIAHDIAKEIEKGKIIDYSKQIGVELDEVEKENLTLPHAKIGAKICKDRYGFDDDMVNAVSYHTTGRPNMSMLEKVIYLADCTDETRSYGDKQYYIDLAKKDIDAAVMEVSRWSTEYLLKKDSIVHLDTVKCYNYYRKLINDRGIE